jgi:hypothetical protein
MLDEFSMRHYTYINQIFGDQSVREIISEVYPSEDYAFKVEPGEGAFEGTDHHVLSSKIRGTVCSVDQGHQNPDIDINDTLCQSYSLLNYFKIPISSNKKAKQLAMVKMYRTKLLNNDAFIRMLDEVIYKGNSGTWKDYTRDPSGTFNLSMNKAKILVEIRKTLDQWQEYGYHYFIGDGSCPASRR